MVESKRIGAAVTIPADEYRRLVDVVMTAEKAGVRPGSIAQAAAEFDYPINTIRSWSQRGHLPTLWREPGSGRYGGIRIVDLNKVAELIASPPPEGRPRKACD